MPVPGSRLAVLPALFCALLLTGCPPDDETPDPPPIPEPEIDVTEEARRDASTEAHPNRRL
jgi:hypothetical protein